MWFFNSFVKKNEVNSQIEGLNQNLSLSFSHVKQDTSRIFQWLNFFKQQLEAQQNQLQFQSQQIQELFKRFELIPSSRQEIRNLIDQHYSRLDAESRIEELRQRIERLIALQSPAIEQIQALSQRLELVEQRQKPRQSFKEKIIEKISKSSKDYVKNLIISYINKYEKISAMKLREIVVEEQGLCSKSSFYRILGEIEALDDIEMAQEGRQKFYFAKAHKSITK